MSTGNRTMTKPGTLKLFVLLGCSTVAGIFGAEALTSILSQPAAAVEPSIADGGTAGGGTAETLPAADGNVVMN